MEVKNFYCPFKIDVIRRQKFFLVMDRLMIGIVCICAKACFYPEQFKLPVNKKDSLCLGFSCCIFSCLLFKKCQLVCLDNQNFKLSLNCVNV